jgi:hypothetical protein
MNQHEEFLKEIEDFLTATGMAPTRFGREAMNDPNFVGRLRRGGCVTVPTSDRVRCYIAGVRGEALSLVRPIDRPSLGKNRKATAAAISAKILELFA